MAVVLLQETHRTTDDNLKLPGFLLAGSILSNHHVNQLRDGTSGKLTGSYSPQRLKEEHQVSQIHKLMTRTPHTQRIATCAAKKSIPRGFNKDYILGWDDSCNHLLREHQQATTKEDINTTATVLLHKLDAGPGGLRLWSLWTSHIQVARRGRP